MNENKTEITTKQIGSITFEVISVFNDKNESLLNKFERFISNDINKLIIESRQ